MPRPSTHADQRLIDTARELLPRCGCSGLNLREVAAKARVNLGMFHYHFEGKSAFVRRVLEEIYESFLRELQDVQLAGTRPSERLRSALLVFASFGRENRLLITSLVSDALRGDPDVLAFVGSNVPRHLKIFLALIRECQEAGEVAEMPLRQAFAFLASAINFPSLVTAALERGGRKKPAFLRQLRSEILTDGAIQQRIDMAMKGISS